MAAGAALAAKRGKRSKSSLKGASRQMAKFDERKRATKNGKDEAQGKAHTQNARKGRPRISATRQLRAEVHTQA